MYSKTECDDMLDLSNHWNASLFTMVINQHSHIVGVKCDNFSCFPSPARLDKTNELPQQLRSCIFKRRWSPVPSQSVNHHSPSLRFAAGRWSAKWSTWAGHWANRERPAKQVELFFDCLSSIRSSGSGSDGMNGVSLWSSFLALCQHPDEPPPAAA